MFNPSRWEGIWDQRWQWSSHREHFRSYRCQTCSNPESSLKMAHITGSSHVWKATFQNQTSFLGQRLNETRFSLYQRPRQIFPCEATTWHSDIVLTIACAHLTNRFHTLESGFDAHDVVSVFQVSIYSFARGAAEFVLLTIHCSPRHASVHCYSRRQSGDWVKSSRQGRLGSPLKRVTPYIQCCQHSCQLFSSLSSQSRSPVLCIQGRR